MLRLSLPAQSDSIRPRFRLALRDAARAFYCQMYYWGRDVMHPGGNLLVRYGFEKIQRTTKEGTSRYRLTWEGGLLELHGFCAGWYPAKGPGICFDRKHDAWRIWQDPSPPEPESLVAGHGKTLAGPENLPLLLQLTARFSRWVIGYETWAQEAWGPSQRNAQHHDFMKLRSRRRWLAPAPSRQWLTAYAQDPTTAPRPKTIRGNPAHG